MSEEKLDRVIELLEKLVALQTTNNYSVGHMQQSRLPPQVGAAASFDSPRVDTEKMIREAKEKIEQRLQENGIKINRG